MCIRDKVVARCTRFGKPMSPRLMMAYCGLYDADLAHSFEVRNDNGELVAAGFGIALGKMFLLENLCARDEAALCFGLSHLARYLDAWDFTTIEGKAPVSYTHLDVYKRQVSMRSMAARSFATSCNTEDTVESTETASKALAPAAASRAPSSAAARILAIVA